MTTQPIETPKIQYDPLPTVGRVLRLLEDADTALGRGKIEYAKTATALALANLEVVRYREARYAEEAGRSSRT